MKKKYFKNLSSVKKLCPECDKPLKFMECVCRTYFIGTRASCKVCGGSGRMLKCPDWLLHKRKKSQTAPQQYCANCNNTGVVFNKSMGILAEFAGSAGSAPCPVCRGKYKQIKAAVSAKSSVCTIVQLVPQARAAPP